MLQSPEVASAYCGALVGCAGEGGGPSEEQDRIIGALAVAVFGSTKDAFEPMAPEAVAGAIVDRQWRHRLVQMMILLEFACHPPRPAMADAVERYAAVLDVHDTMLALGRDALEEKRQRLVADYGRFAAAPPVEPELAGVDDDALATTLRSLGSCAAGTLGRAFFDFYDRFTLPFPGEPNGGGAHLVAHDFTHVIAGYEPVPIDELALQAMLVAATDGDEHFTALVAVLGLSEVGMLAFPDVEPKVNLLQRPGATEALADAVRRGQECHLDFEAVDHLALVDEPLADVRRRLRIPARAGQPPLPSRGRS
jgi:hypothetical protein